MDQSPFPPDFIQNLIASTSKAAIDFTSSFVTAAWAAFRPYLPLIALILFILLVIASIKALLGRTGMLGSVLYHIFYISALAIIVWLKGVEILFNPVFDLIGLVVYRFCYWLVGLILKRFKHYN